MLVIIDNGNALLDDSHVIKTITKEGVNLYANMSDAIRGKNAVKQYKDKEALEYCSKTASTISGTQKALNAFEEFKNKWLEGK